MSNIVQSYDASNNAVYPVTHLRAVRDSSGTTLESMMQDVREMAVGYYECSTSGSTAAKAITIDSSVSLSTKILCKVKFVEKNKANNATMNINGTGAKALYYNGVRVAANNSWYPNEVVDLYYDGTNYQTKSCADTLEYNVSLHQTHEITEITTTTRTLVFNGDVVSSWESETPVSDSSVEGYTRSETNTGDVDSTTVDGPNVTYNSTTNKTNVVYVTTHTYAHVVNNYTFQEAVNAVPMSYRHGGLKLSFIASSNSSVPSSDNKYVQYRLTKNTWSTDIKDWVNCDSVNKYIPYAKNRAKEVLIELYLYGNVDPNETYYIEEFKHISSGVRLYVNKLSTQTTVAIVEGGDEFKITRLSQAHNSRIYGYLIANTTLSDNYNLAANINFDTKVITNLDESPSIKAYLQEQELSARINDPSLFNNCFVRILSGEIRSNELIMIKAIKNIKLIGDWDASKKYAFRWIYRNSPTDGYRLNMYEIGDDGYEAQGSYNIRIIPTGSVVEATGSTYVEFSVQNEPNKKVNAYIDYSVISGTSVTVNTFHKFVLSPDCFEVSESSIQETINPPSSKAVKQAMENLNFNTSIDIAKGNLTTIGSALSEKEACPIVDDTNFVGFDTIEDNQLNKVIEPKRFIAVIHDDLPVSDYIDNRKIYNKYGFNCNFSWILRPFSDASTKISQTKNIQRLLKDGNELGLHAIFGKSYWRLNKMFDVKPDGSSNFAPNITELQGSNPDHTGENAFGRTITATTLISSMYSGIPSDYASTKVVELTSEIVNAINRTYCFYSDNDKYSGLDANDTLMSNKTILQWVEYWYNTWIDSTLGYSSTESILADRFAEDYDDPTKYPDAEHIINGKMVHYQDTANPHYNDAAYQKVGKFTKGLYKGSFSTCNYEVMDMIVKVAQHFARVYFGCKNLTDTHRHGAYDTQLRWTLDNIRYQDRGHNVIDGANGIIYSSKNGVFVSEIQILQLFGISELSEEGPSSFIRTYEGQIGVYFGQRNIRQIEVSNFQGSVNGTANYLNIFGTNASEIMSYSDFNLFTKDIKNQIQYFYKYAGTSQTNNGVTKNIFAILRDTIKMINSCIETNKIPVFAWDTIRQNPAISQAVELLCRYCYDNGIGILPIAKANQIVSNRDAEIGFPNSGFKQTMLKYFDGEDTIPNDAGIPDGWRLVSNSNETIFNTYVETIDGNQYKSLTVTPNTGSSTIQTKIYGLKDGTYSLSFYIKGSFNGSATSKVRVYLQKNKDLLDVIAGTPINTTYPSNSWQLVNIPFTINAPYKSLDKSSPISVICNGYENNVCDLTIRLDVANGESVSLCNPSIEKN